MAGTTKAKDWILKNKFLDIEIHIPFKNTQLLPIIKNIKNQCKVLSIGSNESKKVICQRSTPHRKYSLKLENP